VLHSIRNSLCNPIGCAIITPTGEKSGRALVLRSRITGSPDPLWLICLWQNTQRRLRQLKTIVPPGAE
jgi:hypothetical protein